MQDTEQQRAAYHFDAERETITLWDSDGQSRVMSLGAALETLHWLVSRERILRQLVADHMEPVQPYRRMALTANGNYYTGCTAKRQSVQEDGLLALPWKQLPGGELIRIHASVFEATLEYEIERERQRRNTHRKKPHSILDGLESAMGFGRLGEGIDMTYGAKAPPPELGQIDEPWIEEVKARVYEPSFWMTSPGDNLDSGKYAKVG